jgi:Fe-S-cluster containining protein
MTTPRKLIYNYAIHPGVDGRYNLADFDLPEMKMFAKWHAVTDLVNNGEFWNDCSSAYLDKCVTLPMCDEPAEREAVLKLVKCPPGQCGACCGYDKVAITQNECDALVKNMNQKINFLSDEKGNLFLDCRNGCQFLKNNICVAYAFRPAVCRAFPIVAPKDTVDQDGARLKQIQIRLKCPAAVDVVRTVFTKVCSTGKLMVLPDLSLIPEYENGKGVLGRI